MYITNEFSSGVSVVIVDFAHCMIFASYMYALDLLLRKYYCRNVFCLAFFIFRTAKEIAKHIQNRYINYCQVKERRDRNCVTNNVSETSNWGKPETSWWKDQISHNETTGTRENEEIQTQIKT